MRTLTLLATLLLLTGNVFADGGLASGGLATAALHPGAFPTPIGPVAEHINWLYNVMFIIVAVIAVVVVVPLLYILYRYRRERVKKAATFSHSTVLEATWTIIPALICIFIAVESYRAMRDIRTMPDGAANIEVVAYQFGWDFYYPDASEHGTHVAAAEPTTDDPEISLPGAPRQTKELVVPAGKPVVLHVTSSDVIHSMFVPHLGVKIDAIPGRINYAWFMIPQPGTYLGQCTELCGQAHSEMFFRVKAVTPEEFDAYLKERRVAAGLSATPAAEVSGSLVATDASATLVSVTAPVTVPATAPVAAPVSASAAVSATPPAGE